MAKKKRNTPRRACFLDRCHRSRSIPLGTHTCNLPASFPSERLMRHDVFIGILIGLRKAVSSLGLVTSAAGCPMRPIPPGHCPHPGPISSNRTPDSMGFDTHRTPPRWGFYRKLTTAPSVDRVARGALLRSWWQQRRWRGCLRNSFLRQMTRSADSRCRVRAVLLRWL